MSTIDTDGNRKLEPGQRTEVWTAPADGGAPELVFTTVDVLLEAPNWLPDGALLLNGDGVLWRLDLSTLELTRIATEGLPPVNNDHVLDPDGVSVHCSAADGHVYRVPIAGGRAERETPDDGQAHFLHGVAPDGGSIAYVELPLGRFDVPGRLAVLDLREGHVTHVDVGPGHCDGPEFSPDGAWLYCNTESFGSEPGHAQLARVRVDGSATMERLHASERVDWFPHPSPDGAAGAYISVPPGTLGHPADLPVEVVVVRADDWTAPLRRIPVHGGQGTLNVNSWAPTSDRFAYVAYPNRG
jgi:TolB protein